jgi:hypothetical protein
MERVSGDVRLAAVRAAQILSSDAAFAETEQPTAAGKALRSRGQIYSKTLSRKSFPKFPENLFSRPPEKGAPILQKYIDGLPADERYGVLAPLVRKHWKWFCKAAPYLKFPEPKPLVKEQPIRIGIRVWRMTGGGIERVMQLLVNHLAEKSNYRITVFLNKSQAANIDYLLRQAVEVVPVVKPINWEAAMRKHPQDLMICPETWDFKNSQNALLLKMLGIRVLLQEHMGPSYAHLFRNMREKFDHLVPLYSACDGMSCLSHAELRQWQKKWHRKFCLSAESADLSRRRCDAGAIGQQNDSLGRPLGQKPEAARIGPASLCENLERCSGRAAYHAGDKHGAVPKVLSAVQKAHRSARNRPRHRYRRISEGFGSLLFLRRPTAVHIDL